MYKRQGIEYVELHIGSSSYTLAYNANSGYYEATIDTYFMDDGVYEVYAVALDVSGYTTETTHIFIGIDNTVPTLQVLAPMDGAYVSDTITIEAVVNDWNLYTETMDITVDGNLDDWTSPMYEDLVGEYSDAAGDGGSTDIVEIRICHNTGYYVALTFADPIIHTLNERFVVTLYFDTDNNSQSGYEINGVGAEVMVEVVVDGNASIYLYNGTEFVYSAPTLYAYSAENMEIYIPVQEIYDGVIRAERYLYAPVIVVDGSVNEWYGSDEGLMGHATDAVEYDNIVDIVDMGAVLNNSLYFYVTVANASNASQAFFKLYIDADDNINTGNTSQGIGAEYMLVYAYDNTTDTWLYTNPYGCLLYTSPSPRD